MLRVKKLIDEAYLPKKGSKYSAGVDLYSISDYNLKPKSTTVLSTGIGLIFPEGTYGQVASRSGLASKGIVVHGGVIDSDYQGEIKVILYNTNEMEYSISKGDRIAQVICQKIELISKIEEIDFFPQVSERNTQGIGSTGK